MILESQQERDAFEFVCQLASELTDRRGCNDLDSADVEKFKGLTVDCDDGGKIIQVPINMDFSVIHWLQGQLKGDEDG